MAFKDWFKPKPPPIAVERVWIARPAKLKAVREEVVARSSIDAAVVVLAHFADTLHAFESVLTEQNIAFERRKRLLGSELDACARQQNPAKLLTALTSALAFDALPDGVPERTVTLLLIERHPLSAKDDAIEDFAGGVPCKLSIHVSLDDALLTLFATQNLVEMLRQLGVGEDKPIESPMVSTAIRAAQKKFEPIIIGDRDAPSVEKWIELNCSGGGAPRSG